MIKNIIFDLGAVILDIRLPKTAEAFAALLDRDIPWVEDKIRVAALFRRYETGEWNDEQFRDAVRQVFEKEFTDEEIDTAWNALLLNFPPQRIELLKWLKPRYRTFILSNTNAIHIREVNRILQRDTGVASLNELVERVYLSYEMGKIKPSLDIYEQVLAESGLVAQETLFLDDNAANIAAAKQLNIETVHIHESVTMLDYFSHAFQSQNLPNS